MKKSKEKISLLFYISTLNFHLQKKVPVKDTLFFFYLCFTSGPEHLPWPQADAGGWP